MFAFSHVERIRLTFRGRRKREREKTTFFNKSHQSDFALHKRWGFCMKYEKRNILIFDETILLLSYCVFLCVCFLKLKMILEIEKFMYCIIRLPFSYNIRFGIKTRQNSKMIKNKNKSRYCCSILSGRIYVLPIQTSSGNQAAAVWAW